MAAGKRIGNALRLIEAGFPCHQVGAETKRERGASSALPPLYYLHVWWARRPLTPSRAAILGSLLPADTDPDWFLRELGIEKVQAIVNGEPWTLDEKLAKKIIVNNAMHECIQIDRAVLNSLKNEIITRAENNKLIERMLSKDPSLRSLSVIEKWRFLSRAIPEPLPKEGDTLLVKRTVADPDWFKELMSFAAKHGIRVPNLYGYSRAYVHQPVRTLIFPR